MCQSACLIEELFRAEFRVSEVRNGRVEEILRRVHLVEMFLFMTRLSTESR